MRFNFQPKIIGVIFFLIATAMLTFFNLKAVRDFFLGIDPNEVVTRTLEWKTPAGENRRVAFSIPRGYYAPEALNKSGETIELTVTYPNRAFVSYHEKLPPSNNVNISIESGGGGFTLGDRFKHLIDKGTLEAESSLKLLGNRGSMFVLGTTRRQLNPNESEPETFIFFDTDRKHWVSSRPKVGSFRLGEAVLKNSNAGVHYLYHNGLEADPIIMHQWVMAFVENLEIHNPAGKEK